jgi:hypothetical protein
MKVRAFFNRQCFFAVVLCPILIFLMTDVEFSQPKLFKPAEYQLTPQFFKFVSAGFWPAAADFLWVQTLQRAGSTNYAPETLPELLGFYRLSTSLDPNFYEAYDQAAVLMGFYYEAAYPALEIIDRGIHVYETGNPPQKFWTHPYSLYMYRAYVNAFLRNNWADAKQDYLKASYVKGAPVYLEDMRVWLKQEGSEKKLAKKVLKLLYNNAKDPLIRAKYQEKLKQYE